MRVEIIGGFLGWGKTTTILHLLGDDELAASRTVVLVNEFGEVGVDGDLLAGGGGAVSELPSGCICCSLRADFISQMEEIARRYQPERVIVEPSGVASMRDVLQALSQSRMMDLVDEVRTVLVLDPNDYDWFTHMSPTFVEAQVGLAQVVLLNKTDLATDQALQEVTADLERRNPLALVLPTAYGRFSWSEVEDSLPPVPSPEGPQAALEGFEVVARELDQTYTQGDIEALFSDLAAGLYGEVVRAKGVFVTGEGRCLRADLASGRMRVVPWRCAGRGRVNIIGRGLDSGALDESLTPTR